MKHYTTKYSSKTARQSKTKRDASKRRSGNGEAEVVFDMQDIANQSARQAEIARQVEDYGDVLFA